MQIAFKTQVLINMDKWFIISIVNSRLDREIRFQKLVESVSHKLVKKLKHFKSKITNLAIRIFKNSIKNLFYLNKKIKLKKFVIIMLNNISKIKLNVLFLINLKFKNK